MSQLPTRTHTTSKYPLGRAAVLVPAAALTLVLSSCGLVDAAETDQSISMVVTENEPFQEPTEIAKDLLAEDGWELETTYVTDIIQPNFTVDNGEYDVNFFQNLTYLWQFNIDHDLDLEPIFFMFEQPSGIYSKDYTSLDQLPDGAEVALPVDTANNGRGIKLLARSGLIEIDESISTPQLSVDDIEENPRNLQFVEVDQQSVGTVYDDVEAVFGFARLLATVGVMPEEALTIETQEEALPFAMTIVAQPGFREEEPEKYQALKDAYHSEAVEDWYGTYLDGLLTPAFDRDIDAAWKEANTP